MKFEVEIRDYEPGDDTQPEAVTAAYIEAAIVSELDRHASGGWVIVRECPEPAQESHNGP